MVLNLKILKTLYYKKIIIWLNCYCYVWFVGNAQTFERLEDYGPKHNEYVKLFLQSGKKVSDYSNLNDFAKDNNKIISKNGVNCTEQEFVNEFNKTFLINYLQTKNCKETFQYQLRKMQLGGKISLVVYNSLIEILNSVNDYDKVILIIDNLEKQKLTEFEKNSIGALKSVYKSSNLLLADIDNASGKFAPGSWTIIGDAIGAFVFCYIPPLSVVAGGAISLAVHNSDNP